MAIIPRTELAKKIRELAGENVYLCYQCQECTTSCPMAEYMDYRPAQVMRLVQFGLEDRLIGSSGIWRCLTCENCGEHCPNSLHPREVIETMRYMVMQYHYLDGDRDRFESREDLAKGLRALSMLRERLETYHNISGDDNSGRLIWSTNLAHVPEGLDRKKGAEVIYYVGCVSSLFPMTYGIPQSFVTVLERAGVDFTTMGGDEWCCGYPLLIGGMRDQAVEMIHHNVAMVKALGAKRVVMTCPSCYHSWSHIYPEIVGDEMDFQVMHATEFLAELIEKGTITLKEWPRGQMVVTYHDPCDLGRKSGVYDAPRQIIHSIPGLEFREMASYRTNALCCGGGGNLESFDPSLVSEVARRRIGEAQEVEARLLISACPQCERTLTKAARANKVRIRVMDVAQLVEQVME